MDCNCNQDLINDEYSTTQLEFFQGIAQQHNFKNSNPIRNKNKKLLLFPRF